VKRRTITVTSETDVDPDVIVKLYALYRASFAHLEQLAAARHLLHQDEFTEEIEDRRVVKHISWDAEGEPIGLCTVTSSLDALPWISPGFYRQRFPDHHARGAIHYVGMIMVHPSSQGAGAFRMMVRELAAGASEVGAVLAWDLCEHNESAGLHRLFSNTLMSMSDASVYEVDRQVYFGAVVEPGSFTSRVGSKEAASLARPVRP
jgi:hypothetical protein